MLTKLLKHEFMATWKVPVALYAYLLALGLILHFVIQGIPQTEDNSVSGLIIFSVALLFYMSIIAANVIMMVCIVVRYYKNLYTAEGYLTFTLPVNTSQIVNTKVITGSVWMLGSYLFTLVSVFFVLSGVINAAGIPAREVLEISDDLLTVFSISDISTLAISFLIVSPLSGVLLLYFCVTVGQLWHNHKILGAVLCYLGLYILNGIVTQIVFFASGFFRLMMDNVSDAEVDTLFGRFYSNLLWQTIIISAVQAVIYYIVCIMITKKKVNLD